MLIPLTRSLLETRKRIVLPKISSRTMQKVIQYTRHVKDYPPSPRVSKPLKTRRLEELVGGWYATFIDMPQGEIFDVVNAAEHLGMKSLLDLGCAKVAAAVKGKKAKDIVVEFAIQKDFTPEQEACIKKQYKWTEDLV
eukprot:TRINITY_DN2369_c0_g2_i3.p1 TRINITY_DN2369_c0_g2~~TRINITY_DN2369_c0_g2_i3.p1  ORF type:complete len:138 (+),score=45.61 TRINITY_DN2369_c0_g2_i3:138-551(+)